MPIVIHTKNTIAAAHNQEIGRRGHPHLISLGGAAAHLGPILPSSFG